MYFYRCPFCGAKNFTEFMREYTNEYKKYRTDVCAQGVCHKDDSAVFHIITSLDICTVCDGRLDCIISPIVVAEHAPKDRATIKHRNRKWRRTIRDE